LEVYDLCMASFDALPLCAIMNNQFFCVHGGLSPDILTLRQIEEIDRFQEPPQSGGLCDLLWADPLEEYDEKDPTTFIYNETRGCSYMFGYKAVVEFLERNKLLSVIRAHEAQDTGYKMHLKNAATKFPTVITLFSAPNYLDAYNNKGAVMRFDKGLMNIKQFNCSPHPYWLPNFMNVFTWSLPFVAEKVMETLLVILKVADPELAAEADGAHPEAPITDERKEVVRKKILAASKVLVMMRTLRNEHDAIVKLKAFSPGHEIPQGLLTQGPQAIQEATGDFTQARKMDRINEKRPEEKGKGEDKSKKK